jgi:hypothetical protein
VTTAFVLWMVTVAILSTMVRERGPIPAEVLTNHRESP